MDFPDLTEYIGPIIFGLIAWLSNYFSKKKKPSDGEVLDKKKKEESFSNDLSELYNKITSPEKVEEEREEINVYPEIKDPIIKKEILDETISVNTAEVETDLINKEKEETDEAIIESINDKKKIDESRKKTTNSRNNIRDKIKSKNGLKEAFILKEILDRKYN